MPNISKKMWIAIGIIIVAVALLSYVALATTIVSPYVITTQLTNGTISSSLPLLNISTNYSVGSGCTAYYNNGTTTALTLYDYNGTANLWNYTNAYSNITLDIGDSAGNYSTVIYKCTNNSISYWTNLSVWNGSATNNSGVLYFILDSHAPTLSNDNATLMNQSAYGGTDGMINVSYQATSNNIGYCFLNIFTSIFNGSVMTVSPPVSYNITLQSSATTTYNCSANVSTTQIPGLTYFQISKMAAGISGNTVSSASSSYVNQTGIAYPLKANQWNLIDTFGNQTMQTICNRIPLATYVAWYNNSAGYKNYTTFSCGAAANNATTVADGNGVYVAVSANSEAYLLNYTVFTAPSITLFSNNSSSSADTPWNIAGIYSETGETLSAICAMGNGNISYVSYHSMIDNTYYTHHCGWNINNVTAPMGTAVWVMVRNNTATPTGTMGLWKAGVINVTISP